MKLAALALPALLLVAFVGGASGSPTAAPGAGTRTITVTGTGTVSVVPDRATFSFGVTTAAKTATQALSANAADGPAGLGRTRTVTESPVSPPPPVLGAAAKAAPETSTPVEPGAQQIEADVTVQFALL